MSESALDWHIELTDMIPRLRRYALALTRNADVADDSVPLSETEEDILIANKWTQ